MRQDATWGAAAVIALAAAVGVSTQSAKPAGDSGRGSVTQSGARAQRPRATDKTGKACSDAEKMLQEFLLTQENSVAAPPVCFDDGKSPSSADSQDLTEKASHLKFVIATLPDPLHTHFSLLFDRSTEAIQEAAQDEDYEYDSSWLPWETEEQSFTHLKDQDEIDDRKDAREDQPGIIVFRNKKSPGSFEHGLVVFIVGEEATRGIHRRQFENAAAWINALQSSPTTPSPVSILGPTFSGSFKSLAQLMEDPVVQKSLNYSAAKSWTTEHVKIYSGSATDKSEVEQFGTDSSNDLKLRDWHISFHSFAEDDQTILRSYCAYLNNTGLNTEKIAIISEDETAFGSGGEPKPPAPPGQPDDKKDYCVDAVHLSYPRDISALRAAYQTQSVFSSNTSQQSADTQRKNLPSDLADPAGEAHDTIRAYGGNQTPLSQEAQLLGIVSVLRARRSQYLVIRSSNMLDPLFLANFFRRAYPEGRVVILGSDLLFQRERGSTGISGVMMLSTYPLLPWDWTNWPIPPGTPRRVFGEDLVEGTYIAARFLLHNPSVLGEEPDKCSQKHAELCFLPPNPSPRTFVLPDYEAPFWAFPKKCASNSSDPDCTPYLRPATWLSVLGRNNFYPIAALNLPDPKGPLNQGQKVRTGMPLSMKLCLLFILALAGFHTACCWKASFTAKPAFRAHFAATHNWWSFFGRWRHPLLISIGSILIAFMALVAVWGCGALSNLGEPLPDSTWLRAFLLLTGLIAFSSIVANKAAINRMEHDRLEDEAKAKAVAESAAKAAAEAAAKAVARSVAKTVAESVAEAAESVAKAAAETVANPDSNSAAIHLWLRKQTNWSSLLFLLAITGFCLTFVIPLESALTFTNRVPTYWRSMNLTSGVSPIVPFLSLFVGLYAWFWYSLHGLALFGLDRPSLPSVATLKLKDQAGNEAKDECGHPVALLMFSQEEAAKTELAAIPLEWRTMSIAGALFVIFALVAYAVNRQVPLRSLGGNRSGLVFCVWLDLCFSLLLAEAWQLSRTWAGLKELLVFLDRVAIRRTMGALKGFSWGGVWKMSGNVLEVRYKLVSRQIESINHLKGAIENLAVTPSPTPAVTAARDFLPDFTKTQGARDHFAKWYSRKYNQPNASDFKTLEAFQKSVACLSGKLLSDILIPAWRKETKSLLLTEPDKTTDKTEETHTAPPPPIEPYIRNAEELVCITYLGFIHNILGRMRTIVVGIAWLFVAVTLSVSSYPFDPRSGLSGTIICLFLALGVVISYVYADMHRDATLSHVTSTTPGELGTEFWFKLIGFGVGPVLGLLTIIFPGMSDFFFSWLEPGLASLK